MTKKSVCLKPVALKEGRAESLNLPFGPGRIDYINQVKPYSLEFEITSKCAGSCRYCYSSSTTAAQAVIPRDKIVQTLDEALALGIRMVVWSGGDPIMHPDWYEVFCYAAEKGMSSAAVTSGLISKSVAKMLCSLGDSLQMVGVHIDTINPEVYNKVHFDPKGLEKKIQGYRNLLEAGYPPKQVMAFITLTRPALDNIEETFDWYAEEMGAGYFNFLTFKYEGFGSEQRDWEPTLLEIKRAYMYRASKLGDRWLTFGSTDGFFCCRTNVTVLPDGSVVPCAMMRNMVLGNVYDTGLVAIMESEDSRNMVLMNWEIKGYCGGECENSDVCWGCRATAYHYTGDYTASDPKCFLNPYAPENLATR